MASVDNSVLSNILDSSRTQILLLQFNTNAKDILKNLFQILAINMVSNQFSLLKNKMSSRE
jgi:hypothetical protein